jgi:hypothetical protein
MPFMRPPGVRNSKLFVVWETLKGLNEQCFCSVSMPQSQQRSVTHHESVRVVWKFSSQQFRALLQFGPVALFQ